MPPASLEAYLSDVFLKHPHYDPEIAARVHLDDDGRVTGFVGVFPGRFVLHQKPVRAAIAGALMVEDRNRDPLAGARLLRSVIKGPQDISITESANQLSQGLWERLRSEVVPLLSLDWFRILRPAAAGVSMAAELYPRLGMMAPLAGIFDRVSRPLARRFLAPGEPPAGTTTDTDPSDQAFAAALLDLSRQSDLRPEWSGADIEWLCRHATRKERYGPAHRSIVRSARGGLLGCYLYHAKPGGTGRVVQMLAQPGMAEVVVDCLFKEAEEARLSGMRGRCTLQFMNALLKRRCVFAHLSSTLIHTADPDLAGAVQSGNALINGLAAENWTRLIGGEFR